MENDRRRRKKSNINISFCGKKAGLFPTLRTVIGLCLVLIERLDVDPNKAVTRQTATRDRKNRRNARQRRKKPVSLMYFCFGI